MARRFAPDTPEAQERMKLAFEIHRQGHRHQRAVVLETAPQGQRQAALDSIGGRGPDPGGQYNTQPCSSTSPSVY